MLVIAGRILPLCDDRQYAGTRNQSSFPAPIDIGTSEGNALKGLNPVPVGCSC